MPTYQYACTECGHQLEAVQSFSDAALTECPDCQGKLRKVFNSVGIVFKGSGFYRNDSRAGAVGAEKAGEKAPSNGGDSGAKSDTSSTTTPATTSSTSSSSATSASSSSSSSTSSSGSSGASGSSGSSSGSGAKAAASS